MSLQWTNKHEILRDLHEAQGTIPVDIDNTIYTNGKPLNQSLIEENEINDTHNFDDVEFNSGPDLQLIKQMLDMVRQRYKSHDIVSINVEDMYEMCKNESQQQKTDNKINIEKVKKPKVRRQRNVALASILEAISTRKSKDSNPDENLGTSSAQNTETEMNMKLLKPEDFYIRNEPSQCITTVCSIVEISSPDVTSIRFENNNSKTEPKTFDSYKPSAMADLYYKNYLERSKLQSIHHNFMHDTEKLIKMVDLEEPEILCLKQHRHLLTEECIVCKVLCKNRF